MEHIKALLIKFIATLILLYIVLGLGYHASFGDIFLTALVLGVIAYIIGDLLILPNSSNTVATVSDFVIALIIVWLMIGTMTGINAPFVASLISAILVGIFEYMFHKYLANHGVNPVHNH
ncbi:DUF2512 family protein [Sporolactobacillus sp. THM7-4]|nr:DUF2512 family protein [Sporolactobacillus sp. THM7-4]